MSLIGCYLRAKIQLEQQPIRDTPWIESNRRPLSSAGRIEHPKRDVFLRGLVSDALGSFLSIPVYTPNHDLRFNTQT